jgi:methyl-accepting chemotaxis protein
VTNRYHEQAHAGNLGRNAAEPDDVNRRGPGGAGGAGRPVDARREQARAAARRVLEQTGRAAERPRRFGAGPGLATSRQQVAHAADKRSVQLAAIAEELAEKAAAAATAAQEARQAAEGADRDAAEVADRVQAAQQAAEATEAAHAAAITALEELQDQT